MLKLGNINGNSSLLKLLGRVVINPSFDVEIQYVSENSRIFPNLDNSELEGNKLEQIFNSNWNKLREHFDRTYRTKKETEFDYYDCNIDKHLKIYIRPYKDELLEILMVDQTALQKSIAEKDQMNQQLIALNKINSLLIHMSEPAELIPALLKIFQEKLNYFSAHFVFTHKVFARYSSTHNAGISDNNCLSRLRSLKEIFIDASEDMRCLNCIHGENPVKPCMMIPLTKDDVNYGVLILADKKIDIYDTNKLDFLREIARNISSTLHNVLVHSNPQLMKDEIKRYSVELKQRNKELEYKNRRLEELNQELQKAKNKSEESDRLKSAFLANMSHEIRTPLNGITGFCQLLKTIDTCNKEKVDSYINIIMNSSNQLLKTINNIIIYSKIQSNPSQYGLMSCSLNSELDNILSECSGWVNDYPGKKIKLNKSYDLANGDDNLLLDIVHLKEITKNLLDNAIKFTEQGEVELLYRVEENHLMFRVKDSGIGISYEKKQIIFDRFRQSDDSRNRRFGGLGLGLSIVSSLLSIMKGQVWVKSKENKGTSFYFTVPYEIPESNEKLNEKMKYFERGTLKKMLNKKILLVEDDPASSEYIKVALEDIYTVVLAENGEEALNYLKQSGNFSLVLLDIRLPDINGNDLAKKIKSGYPELPLIAQTANAMKKDRENCIQAGCCDYLTKPISRDELIQTINKHI